MKQPQFDHQELLICLDEVEHDIDTLRFNKELTEAQKKEFESLYYSERHYIRQLIDDITTTNG